MVTRLQDSSLKVQNFRKKAPNEGPLSTKRQQQISTKRAKQIE
jgi:hypothetical protein